MEVSVVISAGRDDPGLTIESLQEQKFSQGWEIILVTHKTTEYLNKHKGIKVYTTQNNNPSLKRNIGVKFSSGRIIAFIDDDAYAPRDWLQKGYDFLVGNSNAAGVGGINLPAEGATYAEGLTETILNFPVCGSGIPSYSNDKALCRKAKYGEVHFVNFFIYRDIFLNAGGANEMIGYGGEDTELIYLIKHKLKKDVYFSSDIWVRHRRRSFGMDYLGQRFLFRFKNGQMVIAYPGMYLSAPAFLGLLFTSFFLPFLLIIKPGYFLNLCLLFFVAVFRYGFLKYRKFLFVLPFALAMHLASYMLGFVSGLIWGILNIRGTLRLRRF